MNEWIDRLIQSAKQGHLCDRLEDSGQLPPGLWSFGQEGHPLATTPLVLQGQRLYLQRNWALESLTLDALKTLRTRPLMPLYDPARFHAALDELPLQPAQHKALKQAFTQTLAVFTGGPGTGKTFTASALIRLLATSSKGPLFKVAIAAPTGKAAAHLEAALQATKPLPPTLRCESTTLHRLLRLQPGKQRLLEEFQIDAHLVVVDEASMLDIGLMLHLFKAIGPQTRLLLLGDPDQLPPVEGASLFPDIAQALGSKLERSLRIEKSELAELFDAVQRGDSSAVAARVERIPLEFEAIQALVPSPIYTSAPDPHHCLQTQSQTRILSPLRQGPFGVDALNRELLAHFKKQNIALAIPILVTQNDTRLQLYNGTAGVLIETEAHFPTADGFRTLPEALLPRYETAFCLSVHKSQGSEFDEVVVLLPPGSEQFGIEALYTAVTRAKRKVTLATSDATLEAMLQISARTRSGFRERFHQ